MRSLVITANDEVLESIFLSLQLRWPQPVVLSAREGSEGIELVETEAPDVVVVDLDLPTMSGFEVLGQIRLFSDVPIIMVTSRNEEMEVFRALEEGADDCITNPVRPVEFVAKVQALLRRTGMRELKVGYPSSFVSNGLAVDFGSREVSLSGETVQLTPTEFNLLSYLVRNEGKVIGHHTLLDRVWGPEYASDTTLLKKYVSRLRMKLGDSAEHPRFILGQRGVGYKFLKPVSAGT